MPYIDRDVYEALAGTKQGKRVFDKMAAEMAPRNAQDLPDWMPMGFPTFATVAASKRWLAAIANSLYTGTPNVASSTVMGSLARKELKKRLVRIVTIGSEES